LEEDQPSESKNIAGRAINFTSHIYDYVPLEIQERFKESRQDGGNFSDALSNAAGDSFVFPGAGHLQMNHGFSIFIGKIRLFFRCLQQT